MTETKAQPESTTGRRLEGRVALVVGGGWAGPDGYAIGVGGAICWHLAREGCRVAVLDIEVAMRSEQSPRSAKKAATH